MAHAEPTPIRPPASDPTRDAADELRAQATRAWAEAEALSNPRARTEALDRARDLAVRAYTVGSAVETDDGETAGLYDVLTGEPPRGYARTLDHGLPITHPLGGARPTPAERYLDGERPTSGPVRQGKSGPAVTVPAAIINPLAAAEGDRLQFEIVEIENGDLLVRVTNVGPDEAFREAARRRAEKPAAPAPTAPAGPVAGNGGSSGTAPADKPGQPE